MSKQTYRELKSELEELILKLQDETVDLDDAINNFNQAQQTLDKLEKYLRHKKQEVKLIRKQK
jgi:exodeoxyribonuclease VII small subunit